MSSNDFSLPTQRCFLTCEEAKARKGPFLCLRRGVSSVSTVSPGQTFFSLPTQRCFRVARIELQLVSLFSAYAEVFPAQGFRYLPEISFLCLRRGVSNIINQSCYHDRFSLPTQRCFRGHCLPQLQERLFSAYAEVFPGSADGSRLLHYFSLPTQRCFQDRS